MAGDLVFTTGVRNLYDDDCSYGIGHVFLVTSNKTMICATKSELGDGIVEIESGVIFSHREFRCARRYIPTNTEVLTFETPANREVETSDDIRWIVLKALSQKE